MLALAFLAALLVSAHAAQRHHINKAVIYDLGVYIAISALVGAKLLFLITEYRYYMLYPSELFSLTTLRSGGVYYGGFILAASVGIWFTWQRRLPVWKITDVCSPGIALGQAIGRLGCLAAGCCYGNSTSQPWGLIFRSEYSHQVVGVPLEVPLHPTQLYESVVNLAIFGILWVNLQKKRFDGQVFILYLLGYSISRFLIEIFRGDTARGFLFNGALSTSQFISLLLLLIATALFFRLRPHGQH